MPLPRSMPLLARAAATGAVAIALVAGCGGSAGAGWTYAPQPSITPPPSVSASASASPGASATGSAAPSTPAGSGSPSTEPVIKVTAVGVAFANTQLEAPGGQPFTIEFDNQDAGIAHNIQIKDAAGASVLKGDIVTGPIVTKYHVGPLAAGAYPFLCDVHPTTMMGTLTVK